MKFKIAKTIFTGMMIAAASITMADKKEPTLEEYKAGHQKRMYAELGIDASHEAEYLYRRGAYWAKGLNPDHFKANGWFRLAAELDSPTAQHRLGEAYYHGLGVRQNISTAIDWFDKSARQNHPPAQVFLGRLYERGTGLERDLKKAKSLYGYACDNGNQSGCDHYKTLNRLNE